MAESSLSVRSLEGCLRCDGSLCCFPCVEPLSNASRSLPLPSDEEHSGLGVLFAASGVERHEDLPRKAGADKPGAIPVASGEKEVFLSCSAGAGEVDESCSRPRYRAKPGPDKSVQFHPSGMRRETGGSISISCAVFCLQRRGSTARDNCFIQVSKG